MQFATQGCNLHDLIVKSLSITTINHIFSYLQNITGHLDL